MEMKVTNAGRSDSAVINCAIKGDKARYDFPKSQSGREGGTAGGGMIIDYAKGEMFILMEMADRGGGAPSKMYMRHRLPKPGEQPSTAHGGAGELVGSPVATGRTEVIAGYRATEYEATGKNGEVHELWLTKELGNFVFPSASTSTGHGHSANVSPAREKLVRDGGFFPLRAITRDAKDAEKSHFEVTKIEKTRLPDSLFTTEGYSEFQIPGLGGYLSGGLNPFKR